MALFNIFRKGSSSFVSSILNVLGMAVAFAAFYIILVQVDYDLNFNKGIKDSEKIFSVTAGDMDGSGKRQMNFCRPLADIIIDCSPNIEYGGALSFTTGYNRYWIEEAGVRKNVDIAGVSKFNGNALKVFGFDAVEGSLDDITDYNTLAVSETIAKRFGLEVGMTLGYDEQKDIITIKAIFTIVR